MNTLHNIARDLATPGKGILAADESLKTAKKRLESVGITDTTENRSMYRELFFTTEGMSEHLSGVILFDETFRQSATNGTPFVKLLADGGVMPGIKVDGSTVPVPNFEGEEFTQGLDGLAARLAEYAKSGAKFTKWRMVVRIGDAMPSDTVLLQNAINMAHCAALVQQAGMVPMVEPEVLLEGDHDISRAEKVTTHTLKVVFEQLKNYKVDLEGIVLKSSMVLAGDKAKASTPDEVAQATIRTFKAAVPKEVPSIVFLSGGQTTQQATENLQAIAQLAQKENVPWQISFSYARALQGPSLTAWAGKSENIPAAQAKFLERLKETAAARDGKYTL